MHTGSSPSVAPPPGRRQRKKERTRQEILGAALDLFGRSGYDAVTIEAICDAADVARGTFFAHFPTKAHLLVEFSRSVAAQFASRPDARDGSATEELRALCEALSESWLAGGGDVMSAMLREFIVAGGDTRPVEDGEPDLGDLIEAIVRRGQTSGEFRKSLHPRLAVAVFLSTSAAILSGGIFETGSVTPAQAREQFLEAVLHGLVQPG